MSTETRTRERIEEYVVFLCGLCRKELGEPGSPDVRAAFSVNFVSDTSGRTARALICPDCALQEAQRIDATLFGNWKKP